MKTKVELSDYELRNIVSKHLNADIANVSLKVTPKSWLARCLAKSGRFELSCVIESADPDVAYDEKKTGDANLAAVTDSTDGKLEEPATEEAVANKSDADDPKRRVSRVERMFGNQDSWQKGEESNEPVGVKGFVLLKCPSCGRKKSFFLKNYQTFERCNDCGATYDIDRRLMRPVYAKCPSCDNEIRWLTNFGGDRIEVKCKSCGAPIDCELNSKGSAYTTI